MEPVKSVDDVRAGLAAHDYLADEGLATAVFLALTPATPPAARGRSRRGKTELAKVLARWTGGDLVRLQCYEGIDAAQAVYEWDYSRQLLHLRAAEAGGAPPSSRTSCTPSGSSCGGRCCARHRRPAAARRRCCSSTRSTGPTTSSRRSSSRSSPTTRSPCPSSAPSTPTGPPVVVVTSNRTRDVHDALKRRCLYHWIDHPDFERELAILRLRAPGVGGGAGPPGRGGGRGAARPRAVQAARRGRDDRLGAGARRARRDPPRRSDGRRHARHRPEVPRGPAAGPRPRARRARRRRGRGPSA